MNATQTGLLAGLILGTAAAVGGFAGFLIALAVGAIGLVVGRVLDGEMDVRDILGRRGRDR
ncbi:hypothetical protein A8924_2264 [Saccharopolyspora erythraea NRRL 2338]|uniref:Uncharacterized protein n=2 Tax=Saccharopolyspora erythraea TaxID=1836 RepID=A4FAV2_SACEN|nr:hypothetical protein [Saccharopolyspora erythraea]PFG94959.1 hypothetical protein A8924_2264 [Saccharopolyspora erythraea NRRL 2338]QRK93429.1 hypothetical protein JQX30_09875 [Saccharopolyspora erythraea]QUH01366.1 hypothetical protein HUO13_11620 [Saccharopolyspora erythraea]CAM01177.1 hypothetical protein SACE_1865 [Saccharopolyspora erythraea NRRL 2338]